MGEKLTCISPVDGSVYAERPVASSGECARVFREARSAWRGWRAEPLEHRIGLCLAALDRLLDEREEIGREITWQMGRPIRHAGNELNGVAERTRYMAKIAAGALAPIRSGVLNGAERFIRREPVGVVFSLVPWNYPYLTAINSVMPALMAGNVVILKHATQTLLAAERLQAAFDGAGFPRGVFQHLFVTDAEADTLISSGLPDMVCFTGSVAGGRVVAGAAAPRFIPVGLELGGKDPAYVRADAKLDFAVENLVDGAFFNCGQSCCAVERIYVHRDVFRTFTERFAGLAAQYILGDPTDPSTTLGPLVRTEAATKVRAQIEAALHAGARAHLDPKNFPADRTESPYLAPQVLTDVSHEMAVMREESFGPVVGIMEVAGDEEAITLMNDSRYGLTASVWTEDLEAAERIGARTETGTFFVNRCDYLDPALAWTAVKESGRGASLSALGFAQLTHPKSFYVRKAPLSGHQAGNVTETSPAGAAGGTAT